YLVELLVGAVRARSHHVHDDSLPLLFGVVPCDDFLGRVASLADSENEPLGRPIGKTTLLRGRAAQYDDKPKQGKACHNQIIEQQTDADGLTILPAWRHCVTITSMQNKNLILQALSQGNGVVRLAPCWVPRSFLMPRGRLKLDPRDLSAVGAHRGGIDERWFSSTTKAANGPLTAEDEGLSYIEFNGKKAL